ncbi:MAG: peptidoglycan-binding protein, partial [Salinibacterium sp.]
NLKVPSCASGYTCLKSYRQTTRSIAADPMCAAYTGAENETAATIIYRVAQSCGISPKVILVMLQKEQGLITSTAPSSYKYRSAMGAGCPDTAACDSAYYGFFNQVRYGAYLLKRYTQPVGTGPGTAWTSRYDLSKPVGQISQILYHPNTACGTKSVLIANQATHSLYLYTPYTPNAAALAAGYGIGNSCSAYGNRNFFQYYTDWFGSTHAPIASEPNVSGTASVGQQLTADPGTFTGPKTGVSPALARSPYYTRSYKGHNVMAIQLALNLAHIPTTIDGLYGTRTKANVRKYQSKYHLSVDGVVGARTWAHMRGLINAPPTYTYAWESCESAATAIASTEPANCTAIVGATDATYTVSGATAGTFILAKLTAKNTAGSSSIWTKSASAVTQAPTNTVAPVVTGTGVVGSALTADPGTFTGFPVPAVSYAWYSCTSAVAAVASAAPTGCTVISGVTSASYVPGSEQAGKFVSANITATNALGTVSLWTASVAVTA